MDEPTGLAPFNFKQAITEMVQRDASDLHLKVGRPPTVRIAGELLQLEQTPLKQMDPKNILDAEGIRKITDITAHEAVLTNDLKQEEIKAIKKKNVETAEAVLITQALPCGVAQPQKLDLDRAVSLAEPNAFEQRSAACRQRPFDAADTQAGDQRRHRQGLAIEGWNQS